MPLPISTTLLIVAAILAGSNYAVAQIIGWSLAGIAIFNELLRAIVLRAVTGGAGQRQYSIPAGNPPVARERTPIEYQE